MIVGTGSNQRRHFEFPALRAYTEPRKKAELVGVNVSSVVGTVNPGDHALDESIEGRSVRIYYEVPIVIGKRVPWIDKEADDTPRTHTKQQQSLLRWKTLEVEKLECAVSKRTRGSDNTIAVARPVARRRSALPPVLATRVPGVRLRADCRVAALAACSMTPRARPRRRCGGGRSYGARRCSRAAIARRPNRQLPCARRRASPCADPVAPTLWNRAHDAVALRLQRACAPTVTWPQSSASPKRCIKRCGLTPAHY